jgi:hypothetical protein
MSVQWNPLLKNQLVFPGYEIHPVMSYSEVDSLRATFDPSYPVNRFAATFHNCTGIAGTVYDCLDGGGIGAGFAKMPIESNGDPADSFSLVTQVVLSVDTLGDAAVRLGNFKYAASGDDRATQVPLLALPDSVGNLLPGDLPGIVRTDTFSVPSPGEYSFHWSPALWTRDSTQFSRFCSAWSATVELRAVGSDSVVAAWPVYSVTDSGTAIAAFDATGSAILGSPGPFYFRCRYTFAGLDTSRAVLGVSDAYESPDGEAFPKRLAPSQRGALPVVSTFEVFPTPTREASNVRYDLTADGHVEILICDLLGRVQARHDKGVMHRGRYIESVDVTNFAPGAYECELVSDGIVVGRGSIVVVR